MRGHEYAELAAFVAVVDQGNFRRAASSIGLSPSALSHVIKSLEERLGAKLLNRTTRSVSMTEAGRDLHLSLAPALATMADAVAATRARGRLPSGTVRLNLPRLAFDLVVAPALSAFSNAYPGIHLDLVVDDGLTDIVAGGFDAGIRPGERVQRDMVSVRVTRDLRPVVVGAPAYLEGRTAPVTPHDLQSHACIRYRFAGSGLLYRWPFAKGTDRFDVAVEGPVTLNDSGATLDAALAGVGLAMSVEEVAAPHVAAGRLRTVLDDWCPTLPGFFLYYPSRRQMPLALRLLVDFLKACDAVAARPSFRPGIIGRGGTGSGRGGNSTDTDPSGQAP